ncbi:MAG: carbon storage regulator [Planctomycetaceae bacterium]|nr:carbon storage regulator [Planctomycetaceae bacterium]
MLVLTRRQAETIVIGQCVAVQVLGIEGGRVRLGITAPAEVSIRRAELAPRQEWERGRVGEWEQLARSPPLPLAPSPPL